jgi:hypothetical protein
MVAPPCDALFRAKTRLPWTSTAALDAFVAAKRKHVSRHLLCRSWGKWVGLVRVKIPILNPFPDIKHARDCKQVKTRCCKLEDASFLQPWASRAHTRLAYERKNESVNHPS